MPAVVTPTASIKYAWSSPSIISNRNTVLEDAGGPVNNMCIGSLDTTDFINSFFISEYPTISEKNFSSGGRLDSSSTPSTPSIFLNKFLNTSIMPFLFYCYYIHRDVLKAVV